MIPKDYELPEGVDQSPVASTASLSAAHDSIVFPSSATPSNILFPSNLSPPMGLPQLLGNTEHAVIPESSAVSYSPTGNLELVLPTNSASTDLLKRHSH